MGRLLNFKNILGVILISALGLTTGCAPDPLFMECPLSNSITAECEASADSIVFTCVVAEHPYCLESVCASWQGSPAECTQTCQADSDCPTGSSCQSHLNMSLCVRNIHLNAFVYDLPDITQEDTTP
jgi:hypothetical protein